MQAGCGGAWSPATSARARARWATSFFALSGFHALHVLGGLVAIAVLLRPAPAPTRARRLRLATVYRDFVAVVWLIIYVAVCVA